MDGIVNVVYILPSWLYLIGPLKFSLMEISYFEVEYKYN